MPVPSRALTVLTLALAPGVAAAAPHRHGPSRTAHRAEAPTRERGAGESDNKARTCGDGAVELVAGTDSETFTLAACDPKAAALSAVYLSILARPPSVPKPKQPVDVLARGRSRELAPGVPRLDVALAERFDSTVAHFRRPGKTPRVVLVSGYRPRSAAGYHSRGRALDFRIDGVDALALAEFCKTLPDTGCGYYPNGAFLHMDVRDPGTGNVAWTDVSRPGEPPRFVKGSSEPTLPELPATPAKGVDARAHTI